jgi:hypothetical protein
MAPDIVAEKANIADIYKSAASQEQSSEALGKQSGERDVGGRYPRRGVVSEAKSAGSRRTHVGLGCRRAQSDRAKGPRHAAL